ncbi:MAG: hypothetical protein KJ000_11580 [Pirellulaceae bacterium]|nr:hypothetical protein [Pirellulaceae bacterium]
MNHLGQPKARSGNFATVYRGFRPDGKEFAIRVFNRRQDERLEHYRTISEYLQDRSMSSMVRFKYDQQGIRSAGDGKLYPLLTMDWVPGDTLFEWLGFNCREGCVRALSMAAGDWLNLVRELADHGVVHGDLQHGNVMVSPEGHFKLVDYDCMGVPSLIGRRNLETGLPPYQHPGRNGDTCLFSGLDNFSAIVIYVALRALAASPGLWRVYVDKIGYDRILFREDDFREPASSPLYRDLAKSPDEQVRDLAHDLFELPSRDLRDVPPIDEFLQGCKSSRGAVVPAQPHSFRNAAFPSTRPVGTGRNPSQSPGAHVRPETKAKAASGKARRRGPPTTPSAAIGSPHPSGASQQPLARAGQSIRPKPGRPPLPSRSVPTAARRPAEPRSQWMWWFAGSAAALASVCILMALCLIVWLLFYRQ